MCSDQKKQAENKKDVTNKQKTLYPYIFYYIHSFLL